MDQPPFLVDPRDDVALPPVATDITKDGQLLRASAVFDDVTADNEGYVYFDTETGKGDQGVCPGPRQRRHIPPADVRHG